MPKVVIASESVSPPFNRGSKRFLRDYLDTVTGVPIWAPCSRGNRPPFGGSAVAHEVYGNEAPGWRSRYELALWLLRVLAPGDVLHSFFAPTEATSAFCRMARRLRRCRWVQSIPTALDREGRFSTQASLFGGDTITVFSRYSADRLAAVARKSRVVCIRPGIATTELKAAGSERCQELRFTICFPGNLAGSGSVPVLSAIIRAMNDRLRETQLVLACRKRSADDPRLEEELLALASAVGVRNRVVSVGTVANPVALIATAHVVVLPFTNLFAKFDIPLVLLESMCLGIPVVVTDVPPLNEVLVDGLGGFAVRPGDLAGWIETLERLRDPGLRARVGREAAMTADKEFNIKRAATELRETYGEVCC